MVTAQKALLPEDLLCRSKEFDELEKQALQLEAIISSNAEEVRHLRGAEKTLGKDTCAKQKKRSKSAICPLIYSQSANNR